MSDLSDFPLPRRAGERRPIMIEDVEVAFCWIPPGKFIMGVPDSEKEHYDNAPQHEVALTRGFWMAETLTTQEFWQAVMVENPSTFGGVPQLPVDSVSWFDAVKFAERLNQFVGNISVKFRLPTEAEWEYACRAGTTTPFNFGSSLNGDRANTDGVYPYPYGSKRGKEATSTVPVKSYAANAWGLYDMHGNLFEWCSDWLDDYPEGAATDPTGPATGSKRVLRGGGWVNSPVYCRSGYRTGGDPAWRYSNNGCRLVMTDDE